ncbi:MAG TPA: type II toxin-antitoxin system VapC family toxin [Thermoanaerobaculia bacterium]|nr:type II toxin-antitoxin system VapC family toxin [Thermoanaerobaculia bacterium]
MWPNLCALPLGPWKISTERFVPFLFDTDAVSEVLKKRPAPAFLRWLATIPRGDQLTSAIVIGELYRGAFRSSDSERHLTNIESRVLPAVTILPFDTASARIYGEIHAKLASEGQIVADADLQIAATAIRHELELVTGNLRHFERIPGLRIHRALAEAR